MKKIAGILVLAFIMLVVAACGNDEGASNNGSEGNNGNSDTGSSEQEAWKPSKDIEVVVPSGAGGGWDTTARMTFKNLKEQDLLNGQDYGVINKPGGGGAIGWAYVHERKGDNHEIFVSSPPILLVPMNGQSEFTYEDFTPIANMITDFGAYAVRADSKWDSVNDLFDQMKKDPSSVTVVGASSPGSMDHIQFMKAAKAAGVDISKVKYVADADGALTDLLNGSADVYSTGIAESVEQAKAGKVKVLAVTSENRLSGEESSKFPTLKEQGIDTTFFNWRGFFGPPDMDPAAVKYYETQLKKLNDSDQWAKVRKKYGWKEKYMGHDEYLKFIKQQKQDYEQLMDELGLGK